jgi:predicted component of type VI protein secretion system
MAALSVSISVAGEPRTIKYEFSRLPVTFGRHADNDVRLSGRYVSNFHARVELRQGRLCVLDLGSTNGTHVGPREAGALQRLARGTAHVFGCSTEFWIGHYRLELHAGEPEMRPAPFEPMQAGLSSLGLPPLPGAPSAGLPSVVGDAVAPLASTEAASECPNTRDLSALSPEAMALRGLQELVDSLAPGLSLTTAGDVARLVTRVHAALEAFCHGFASISAAQREQLSQLARACQLEMKPRSRDVPPRPRDIAAAILDFRTEAAPPALDLASGLSRLLAQEATLLDGVIDGIGALLSDLDPARIEAEAQSQSWRFDFARRARHWEAYRRCYAELSQRKGALPRVFGTALARAYAIHEARRVERARDG